MNNIIGVVIGLILVTAQSNQAIESNIEENTNPAPSEIGQVQGIENTNDPKCKTPQLQPDHTAQIIRNTQTMDLNFVALAEAESGLYNISQVNIKGTPYSYRGIFQVSDQFHILNDYCDPAEQVRWLEYKLQSGANPKRLFPNLYQKLYEK